MRGDVCEGCVRGGRGREGEKGRDGGDRCVRGVGRKEQGMR